MKKLLYSFITFILFIAPSIACTVCFGGADSKLTKGFTWGIIFLGSLPYLLLAFFVTYIIIKSKKKKKKELEPSA